MKEGGSERERDDRPSWGGGHANSENSAPPWGDLSKREKSASGIEFSLGDSIVSPTGKKGGPDYRVSYLGQKEAETPQLRGKRGKRGDAVVRLWVGGKCGRRRGETGS